MCTVSWRPAGDGSGYDLFFNRDESRRRPPAIPPDIHQGRGNGRYLAASDPQAGGTWLATTDAAETFGLLNLYPPGAPPGTPYDPPEPRSRGLLVADLAAGALALPNISPASYRPFLLVHLSLPCAARLWRWDGTALRTVPIRQPVSTSSYAQDEALAFRRALFHRLPQPLFHHHHDPHNTKLSPRMERGDAATVSITHLQIRPGSIRSAYFTPPDFNTPRLAQL
ncbi:NRDE family protein [soil metagenome]